MKSLVLRGVVTGNLYPVTIVSENVNSYVNKNGTVFTKKHFECFSKV